MVDIRGLLPDFLPTNETGSNIYKYSKAHDDEFDEFVAEIEELKTGIYVAGQVWDSWDATNSYEIDDRVSYEGINYRALSDDDDTVPLGSLPNPNSIDTVWNPDAEVQTDITVSWDDSTWDDFVWDNEDQSLLSGYDRGEEVLYEGRTYRALSDLIVIEPNSVETEWEENTTYETDRYVVHNGISYRSRVETSDEPQPVLHGDWKPIWKGLWERFDDPRLDRVGALFGRVGKRNGRNDVDYRQYLQSLVEAFKGKGEKKSIRKVVGAAIVLSTIDDDDVLKRRNIDDELLTDSISPKLATAAQNVELSENFEELEYDIRLTEWDVHAVSNLVEIADTADAAGVTLAGIAYDAGPLEPLLQDSRFDEVTLTIDETVGYGANYGEEYGFGTPENTETVTAAQDVVSPTATEYDGQTSADTRFTDISHTEPPEPSEIVEAYADHLVEDVGVEGGYGSNYGSEYGGGDLSQGLTTITEGETVVVEDQPQEAEAAVVDIFSDVTADEFDELTPTDLAELSATEFITDTATGIDTEFADATDSRTEPSVGSDTILDDISHDDDVDVTSGVDTPTSETQDTRTDTTHSADATTTATTEESTDTTTTTETKNDVVEFTLAQQTGYGSSYGTTYGEGIESGPSEMTGGDTVDVTVTDV